MNGVPEATHPGGRRPVQVAKGKPAAPPTNPVQVLADKVESTLNAAEKSAPIKITQSLFSAEVMDTDMSVGRFTHEGRERYALGIKGEGVPKGTIFYVCNYSQGGVSFEVYQAEVGKRASSIKVPEGYEVKSGASQRTERNPGTGLTRTIFSATIALVPR